MDRRVFLRGLFAPEGKILEIGPSHAPVFPKAAGYDVETLDYDSADGLRARYSAMGVDHSEIEEVDFVSDGSLMDEVIPSGERYDFIFSSHVIEHVPDFVAFFKSCERLLKTNGRIALAVPDKRFCFDALRPATTTGEVLQAHWDRRCRPSSAQVFDFFSLSCRLEDRGTWSANLAGMVELTGSPANAVERARAAESPDGGYTDVHSWCFTPFSFRLLMHDLAQIGAVKLVEDFVQDSGSFEFYLTYRIGDRPPVLSRSELVRACVKEQALSCLKLLSAPGELVAAALTV